MGIELDPRQLEAVHKLRNGNILCGGVGTGKSRTALAYYYIRNGGYVGENGKSRPMTKQPMDLHIITTARKRDTHEWEGEMIPFLLSPNGGYYKHKVVIDSWNNINKYATVTGSFFIFDEQRVVGKGVWAKAFRKIAKFNEWILLSATPGDTWQDYMQVFIANGFFKNPTQFYNEHVVFSPRVKFPKVDRYLNETRLIRLRDKILVDIPLEKHTEQVHEYVYTDYDRVRYKTLTRDRWNPWEDKPIENANELCLGLRKVVNTDESREIALLDIFHKHPRLIVFYNFNYERDILLSLDYGPNVEIAEWNGHKHQPIPTSESWVYLVQYTAGAEGWNCITTDTIVFWSQHYSYKIMAQACGRIDRMNTQYHTLYYYHLLSRSGIDLAIRRALTEKRIFNEMKFVSDKRRFKQ